MARKSTHGKSTTAGQHDFGVAPQVSMQRSVFDRSCGVKTTFDAGQLIPVFVDEIYPGDTVSMSMVNNIRLATPLRPIMDNIYVETHWFFTPNRLLWDNWEKFNGAQDAPGDSTSFIIPYVDSGSSGGHTEDSLYDYLGIPPYIENLQTNALFHRNYALIWNEWFRDQNLQDPVVLDLDDGPDTATDYVILKRGKRKDYFTGALPWPQKGDAVLLPLGTTAPVNMLVDSFVTAYGVDPVPTFDVNITTDISLQDGASDAVIWSSAPSGGPNDAKWNTPNLILKKSTFSAEADLSAASSATINTLRLAFQTQKVYERDARGGTRYVELLKSHWGVTSPDFRHQRPEFLGSSKQVMGIHQVPQTFTDTANTEYVGDLGGFGQSAYQGHIFTKSFTEHGILMAFASARADLNYQQGLDRMFSRSTRWDYYIPALANLGEQAILNKEIYAQGLAADDLTFGFQERWGELRYKPSIVTSRFRSSATVPLDVWHLSQEFSGLPVLGSDFIEENPPIDRVTTVLTEPHFIYDAFYQYKHARALPTYSVPGKIDQL